MKLRTCYLLLILLMAITINFISCQKDINLKSHEGEQMQNTDSNIPFAELNVLTQWSEKSIIIDYKLSRKVALAELMDFAKGFPKWNNGKNLSLSEYPVIVYQQDIPKLYEFIVYDKNKPIGTISAFAQKEVPDFIFAILPFIRNYEDKKSLVYSSVYPHNSEEIVPAKSMKMGTSRSEGNTNLLTFESDDPDTKKFWADISAKKDLLLNLTDGDIVNVSRNSPIMSPQSRVNLRYSESTFYTIPTFDNDNLQRTRFSGACGPAALAWIYRGFYNSYKGKVIPLHGEPKTVDYNYFTNSTFDVSYYRMEDKTDQLSRDLYTYCRIGQGLIPDATLIKDIKNAVFNVFPSASVHDHIGTLKGAPRRAIERGNPVILMIVDGFALHYIVGFGTKNRYTKILGINFHTDSWLLVSDNGTKTQEHNYLPYYRNSNFFNFANKYLAMREIIKGASSFTPDVIDINTLLGLYENNIGTDIEINTFDSDLLYLKQQHRLLTVKKSFLNGELFKYQNNPSYAVLNQNIAQNINTTQSSLNQIKTNIDALIAGMTQVTYKDLIKKERDELVNSQTVISQKFSATATWRNRYSAWLSSMSVPVNQFKEWEGRSRFYEIYLDRHYIENVDGTGSNVIIPQAARPYVQYYMNQNETVRNGIIMNLMMMISSDISVNNTILQ